MFGEMAADPSMGMGMGMGSLYHHMLSFQSNPNPNSDSAPSPTPPAALFLPPPSMTTSNGRNAHSAPNYKFVTGSPADWTAHELALFKEGLIRYAHEPNIIKYIKIAALLPTRTIRDVALRCCWPAAGKESRRKPDELYAAKKIRDLKEKMVASTSLANFHMAPPNHMVPFTILMHHPGQNSMVANQVPVLGNATRHLLEENNQLLSQISANIETFKFGENMDLFLRTNNNIRAISQRMSETPGIMGQMHPLPVHVNEDHLNSLLQLDRVEHGNNNKIGSPMMWPNW